MRALIAATVLVLAARAHADPTPATPRWIPGDLHMHVAPFDAREGQTLTVEAMDAAAHAAGLEWVIATPHIHPRTWDDPERRRDDLVRWKAFATAARAAKHTTIIPGTEFTVWGYGHFGVSGVDLATVGDDFLASAAAAGAFIVVNHPFATSHHISGIPQADADYSFRPWTEHRGAVPHLDGVEVWNLPLALADLITRRNGQTGEQLAFAQADALARSDKRRVAVVGGSDSHTPVMAATTWVLAPDASEASILAALHRGATCVGGPAAGTLEAHGDHDGTRWSHIGDAVHAVKSVDLRWTGHAHVFVDGADVGEYDASYTHHAAGGVHTYRIVIDTSRCGFIYANID